MILLFHGHQELAAQQSCLLLGFIEFITPLSEKHNALKLLHSALLKNFQPVSWKKVSQTRQENQNSLKEYFEEELSQVSP